MTGEFEVLCNCYRTVVHILSSVVRILVTGAVVGAYVPLSGRDWSALTSVEEKEKQLVLTVMAIQVSLPVCLSVPLSVSPSVCLSVCLSVFISVCL